MISLKFTEKSVKETLKYFDSFAKKKQAAIVKELQKSAIRIESDAKRGAPVHTGRLRASIHAEYEGKTSFQYSAAGRSFNGSLSTKAEGLQIIVGTNVEYAPLVEFGGQGRGPRPFLFPAYLKEKAKFIEAVFKVLQKS